MKRNRDSFLISKTDGPMPIELMHGRYSDHEFPRHFHETYVVQVVVRGVNEFQVGRGSVTTGPEEITFLHPGETHTGKSREGRELEYRAFYPTWETMARLSSEIRGIVGLPEFGQPCVHDPDLAHLLVEAHREAESKPGPESKAAVEAALAEAVDRFAISRPAGARKTGPVMDGHDAVRRIRTLVAQEPGRNWTLEDFAEHCAYSPFHLVRLFRKAVGMPPHQFLQAYRAERARQLLRDGRFSWEAAAMLGYSDQAHFTRVFRRIVGLTPGAFRMALRA